MFVTPGIRVKLARYAAGLIALLWFYAGISKLMEFRKFAEAMHKQPFSPLLQALLTFGLPPLELVIATALLTKKFNKAGLYISAVLLFLFTLYIILILTRAFGHIPCACGGVISHMGWNFHLWFNIIFLALNLITIFINQRKEPGDNR